MKTRPAILVNRVVKAFVFSRRFSILLPPYSSRARVPTSYINVTIPPGKYSLNLPRGGGRRARAHSRRLVPGNKEKGVFFKGFWPHPWNDERRNSLSSFFIFYFSSVSSASILHP